MGARCPLRPRQLPSPGVCGAAGTDAFRCQRGREHPLQADDFIRALPHGYDTGVGPRGTRLSGGQRQRVAIARAVLKAAPVLVLDEATSALDPATEAHLLPALRRACSSSAILLVAHRYSTVRHADRIVVLEHGRVIETGTPTALLDRRGAYWRFAEGPRALESASHANPR